MPTKDSPFAPHHFQGLSLRLRTFMADSRLKIGDKLPSERSLAASFGVSRNSVRAAINTLAEQGLVESRRGDGTYICSPNLEPFENALIAAVDSESVLFDAVMEFRSIVEPAIGRLAAVRRTPEQLKELKSIVCDQQRRLLLDEDDGELDADFHLWLARCTHNSLLITTIERLNDVYRTGRTPDLRSKQWRQFSIRTHLRIIDAVEKRLAEDCAREILEHLGFVIVEHPFAVTRDPA